MELLTPPSFLLDSKWVQGENLQFQVPSTCHHPSIFCLILTHSTELHLIDWNKLHPLPVCYHWKTVKYWTCVSLHLDIVLWKLTQAFVSALSTILFASSDLGHANIFIAFIINMIVLTIIADSNDHMGHPTNLLGVKNINIFGSWVFLFITNGLIWSEPEKSLYSMPRGLQL